MTTSEHQMELRIVDNRHQWVCTQCARVVSVEDGGLVVVSQGDIGAIHIGKREPSSSLGLEFEADIIPPEEKALFDRWSSEF